MSDARVVVYGASGVTGTLVAEAVAQAIGDRGASLVLAGRDRARLAPLAARLGARVAVAAAHDAGALAAAFDGARVVIGCAGPFTRIGATPVAAAIAAGAHWIDVASEQGYLRALCEEHDQAARKRGVTVVGGVGAAVALGDWAARWAAEAIVDDDVAVGRERVATGGRLAADRPLDAIVIGHAIDDAALTPGMQRALVAALTGPAVTWRANRWDPERAGARATDLNFGGLGVRRARWFPGGEIITLPRHVAANAIDTFLAGGGAAWPLIERAASLFGLLARAAAPAIEAMLEPLIDPTRVPDGAARERTRFAVVAEARRGFAHARVCVTGGDVQGITARIAADAARALCTDRTAPHGVIAPAQAFDGRGVLTALAASGAIAIERSF